MNVKPLSKAWDWLIKAKITKKCISANMQNPPVWQNCSNFWANVAIWCPVRCWISNKLLVIYISWLEAPSLPLWVCCHHKLFVQGIVAHLHDCNPKSLNTSFNIKTPILKVSITVSISRLKSCRCRYQSQYQDCNFESLNISLNIKTAILKVPIRVSISILNFQKSQYQSQYQD